MKRYYIACIVTLTLFTRFVYPQSAQGLIGYWPLNGNAIDSSGYNNTGSIFNVISTSDRNGNPNGAYYFDGATSYIDCGKNIPSFTNQVSISVWIKTNTLNSAIAYIVGKYGWTGSSIKGFHLLMTTNFTVQFAGRDQIDTYNYITSGNITINDNKWHHLVGTINSSIYELWVDGVKVNSLDNYHSNVDLSQTYNLYIGAHFNGGIDQNMHFAGTINDVRLYNRVLSISEIEQLFNVGKTTYQLVTSANPTQYGTTSGDAFYSNGQIATVTATPNYGYIFVNWTENGVVVSKSPTYSFTVNGNRNLVAYFKMDPLSFSNITTTNITQTSFTANWNAVNGATGYYLDIAIDNQFQNILALYNKKKIVNNLNCTVNNLAPGILFYYRLFAYSDSTVGQPSKTITVLTLPTVPAPPIVQAPYYRSATSFYALWTAVSGATGYYFDLAIDQNMNNNLVNFDKKNVGNVSDILIDGLTTNMNYYYRVKAYNSVGESDYSNIMEVTLTPDIYDVTGINKVNGIPTNFELSQNYPNPFNPTTKIQFSLAKEVNVKLSVYNVLGKEVMKLVDRKLSASIYSVNFNANNLPSGIYFYRIIAGDYVQTKKMLLMK